MTIDVERGEIVNKFIDGYGTTLPPYQWNNDTGTHTNDSDTMFQTKHTAFEKNKVKHNQQCVGHLDQEIIITQPANLQNLGFKLKDKKKLNWEGIAYAENEDFVTDRIYETLNNEDIYEKHNHNRVCMDSQKDRTGLTSVQSNVSETNEIGIRISERKNPIAKHCMKARETAFLLTQNKGFRNSTMRFPDSLGVNIQTVTPVNNGTLLSHLTDYENDFTVIDDTLDDDVFESIKQDHSNYYENITYKSKAKNNDLNADLNLNQSEFKNSQTPKYGVIRDTGNNSNKLFLGKSENPKDGNSRNELNDSCHIIARSSDENDKKNKCKNYLNNCRTKTNDHGRTRTSFGKNCDTELSRTNMNSDKTTIIHFCNNNRLDVDARKR